MGHNQPVLGFVQYIIRHPPRTVMSWFVIKAGIMGGVTVMGLIDGMDQSRDSNQVEVDGVKKGDEIDFYRKGVCCQVRLLFKNVFVQGR